MRKNLVAQPYVLRRAEVVNVFDPIRPLLIFVGHLS
jgi:hypothetical protein